MQSKIYLMQAVVAFSLLSSCTYHGSARITSIPEGAQVHEFGSSTFLGVTPLTHTWSETPSKGFSQVKQAQQVTVRVAKPGYKTKMEAFTIPLRKQSVKRSKVKAVPVSLFLEKNT